MQRLFPLLLFCGSLISAHAATSATHVVADSPKALPSKSDDDASLNLQAVALVRRADETSNVQLYGEAQDAVNRSLKLAPDNFETPKIEVSVLLGQHEYAKALEEAQQLNKRIPDDVAVYGLLTDAYEELGDYKNAEVSAQWMLNLRPGNRPALIHAAHLRDLFGELDGSYELFNMAYQSTVSTQAPERAGILTQMGRVRWEAGRLDDSEKLLLQAIEIDPEYNAALGQLATLQIAQKRYGDAIATLEKQNQSVSRAKTLFNLAEAYRLDGREPKAKEVYTRFLKVAAVEAATKDNANLELVFYYAGAGHDPKAALALAEQEYALRKDVHTIDAYAWALHVNGRDAEAHKQYTLALAVGVRDPVLLQHSAAIQ